MKKTIIVELELESETEDKVLTDEEIRKDIIRNEINIGFEYYYTVKSVIVQ